MNIIISGICGKMGTEIYEEAKRNGIDVVCGVDKVIKGNFDCPVYKNFFEVNYYADVIIDFSDQSALINLLEYATQSKTPLVIGTTGLSENDESLIENASSLIPVFKASNTSLCVSALIEICKILSEKLDGYDVEIIDCHHNKKKDAPSGTSYAIYNAINSAKNGKMQPAYGRKGNVKRNKNEICIHSVRGGGVVGEHEILFLGENDCLKIKHTAYSKRLFADGAIKASKFIIGKPNGLYGMEDFISSI